LREPKSERSRRTVDLPQEAVEALRRQFAAADSRPGEQDIGSDTYPVFANAAGERLLGDYVRSEFRRLLGTYQSASLAAGAKTTITVRIEPAWAEPALVTITSVADPTKKDVVKAKLKDVGCGC